MCITRALCSGTQQPTPQPANLISPPSAGSDSAAGVCRAHCPQVHLANLLPASITVTEQQRKERIAAGQAAVTLAAALTKQNTSHVCRTLYSLSKALHPAAMFSAYSVLNGIKRATLIYNSNCDINERAQQGSADSKEQRSLFVDASSKAKRASLRHPGGRVLPGYSGDKF